MCSETTLHDRGEMSANWAELSVAVDVWKSANPEVGQGQTEKDSCPSDAEGMNAGRVAMTLMAEVQVEGGAETEADGGSGRPVGATRGVSRVPS